MSGASNPLPNAEAGSALPASEPYRPLSILALLGFVLGVLFALLILVGGLTALFQREPWLLPVAVFVVPLGTALLSWLARTRVLESEGALSGLSLANWGIGLSLACGLLYGAYYLATYLVVRQQASDIANRYVELLEKGEIDQAYLLTLKPLERQSAQQGPREALEISHNMPGQREPGEFSRFKQSRWVHILQSCSDRPRIAPLGVASWSHDRNGYVVTLLYRVDTSLGSFDLHVTALGEQSRSAAGKGRQWTIVASQTGEDPNSEKLSEEGEAFMRLAMSARNFASQWTSRAEQGQGMEMYLEALPRTQRERLRRASEVCQLQDAVAVLGSAPLALQDASCKELLEGYEAFSRGALVVADPKTFWAPAGSREKIIHKVKMLFDPHQAAAYRMNFGDKASPARSRSNGEIVYSFSVQLMLSDSQKRKPEYIVEAALRVGVPEDQITATPTPWRIVDLQLVSGHSAPASAAEGHPSQAPGAPAGLP